jgi:hypothetical protein
VTPDTPPRFPMQKRNLIDTGITRWPKLADRLR